MKKPITLKMVATMFVALLLAFIVVPMANAQVIGNVVPVNVTLNISEQVSLSCTPGTVPLSLNLPSLSITTTTTINCTSSWSIGSGHTSLKTYAWWAGGTKALVGLNPSNSIPSSVLTASIDGGAQTGSAVLSGTNTTGGDTNPGWTIETVTNPKSGSLQTGTTHTVLLAGQLAGNMDAPDSYTGTLNFQTIVN
jgi:hypothetical protein